ncbi:MULTISPECIES: NAD(P)-binding domain-containing protein [unclassified Bacillus cereus group]|uniref:NAD(P)-binding domain-containing protein n=1 Tax=unclassified Bacillus cereus group TaxID=2750818 RepID=UPI001F56B65E|nr:MULTISPECIES: NAD(P)-binding domain-containing protein [unclassified Bacillus cereus group]
MDYLYDVVIIGAGPGGLQTALTLQEIASESQKDLKLLVIEEGEKAGTFFENFPVHGTLISNNKLYTGKTSRHRYSERFDWNSLITKDKKILMRNYSREFFPKREALVEMLNDLVEEYRIPVKYKTKWENTKKDEFGNFEVYTSQGVYKTKYLVVAAGMGFKQADIEGIEHTTPYPAMKKKEFYKDKRVLILGKGNSGMECAQEILNEANFIMLASPSSVNMAYKTHYVGHVRAVNALLIDNYQLKHQAGLLDCNIQRIEKNKDGYNVTVKYVHAEGEIETLFFHEVISATGFTSNITALSDLNIDTLYDGKYPAIKSNFESVNHSNLFFAGTQTHGLDYKKTFSGFIHGFRYNSKILANILAEKLNYELTYQIVHNDEIINYILEEFNDSPDLYLQPGYVVKVFEYKEGEWRDLGHVTLEYFKTSLNVGRDKYLMALSLEYGDIHKFQDPLSIPRSPGDINASVHIHPVIRVKTSGYYKKYELEEDLENQFLNDDKYHSSLLEVLKKIQVSYEELTVK